jgi:hypothetical protein
MMTSRQRCSRHVVTLLTIAIVLVPSISRSQSAIENAISGLNRQNAEGYLQPVADLFGANINSGYFRTASISTFGFHLSFDIVGMAAPVSDEQKTFTSSTPAGFNPATFQTATIFGEPGTTVSHATNTALKYRGSDGIFNTKMFPYAMPQVTIGSVLGTDAIIRYVPLPKIGEDKIPATTTWSAGVRHSISQYIPLIPVSIAAGVLYTKFTCGDIFDATGLTYGVQVSKSFSVLTVYGGFNMESSKLKVTYTSSNPVAPEKIEMELTGKRKASFTGGLDLSLGGIHIFGNANLGSVTNFVAGLGFGN